MAFILVVRSQDEYVPLMAGTKYCMQKVVSALRWIVGDLYHTVALAQNEKRKRPEKTREC